MSAPSAIFASSDIIGRVRAEHPGVPVGELIAEQPGDMLGRGPVPVAGRRAAQPVAAMAAPPKFPATEADRRVVAALLRDEPAAPPAAPPTPASAFAAEFKLPSGPAAAPKAKKPSAFAQEFALPLR